MSLRLASLPALVDADARLVHRGRWVTLTFLLEVGEDAYLVDVVEGRTTFVDFVAADRAAR